MNTGLEGRKDCWDREGSNLGLKDDFGEKRPISYRDMVNQGEKNWSELLKEWGLSEIEEELMKQDQEDVIISRTDDAIPVVKIEAETRHRLIQPLKNCLIGKVVGKNVGYKYIVLKTCSLWNPSGKVETLDLGSDYCLFQFEKPEDFKHAILEGLWFVNGHHFSLMRWTANFMPSESSISRIVVWLRLPELPLDYYDEKILFVIAGKLGKSIKIDKTTKLFSRGGFARVCVEIDTNASLRYTIRIGKIIQKIESEGINLICFSCRKMSHKKD
ncbi:hypothetical protein MKX01_014853, partial [Papaver californicum]